MLEAISKMFDPTFPASFVNFSFLPKYASYFVDGVLYTLALSIVAVLLAVIPALLLALMRLSKNKVIHTLSGAYIAIFRSTPLMVQLAIIYFGVFYIIQVPRIYIGFIRLDMFLPFVVSLALNSSAYVAEIFRAGILAVDSGQTEAARSLGLSQWQAMKLAPGHQERAPRSGQRGGHHGEGVLRLLRLWYGRADVCRQKCGRHNFNLGRSLCICGIHLLLHQLPRQQGDRSNRKEDAPWRQAVI